MGDTQKREAGSVGFDDEEVRLDGWVGIYVSCLSLLPFFVRRGSSSFPSYFSLSQPFPPFYCVLVFERPLGHLRFVFHFSFGRGGGLGVLQAGGRYRQHI